MEITKKATKQTPNIKQQVVKAALQILGNHPEGVEYANLCNLIGKKLPDVNSANVRLHVYRLPKVHEDEVYKPEHGKYRLKKFALEEDKKAESTSQPVKRKEQKLYPLVADFLRGMDECTNAIPLGGNHFGGKNNTPDVIGIMQPGIGQVLDFPIEVVSAEVKDSSADVITGFGQACAYRLFSHKSYLVVPDESTEEMGRVESLCNLFGIGLIVFKRESNGLKGQEKLPKFTVKSRAVKHSPDMFYFEKYPDAYLRKNPRVSAKLLHGRTEQEND